MSDLCVAEYQLKVPCLLYSLLYSDKHSLNYLVLIKNIEKYFSPAREEKRFEKLKNIVVKSFSGAAIVFTGALGLWELGVYLKETWETRELASNYANVGIELYYKENNTKVAKEFLEKAIEYGKNLGFESMEFMNTGDDV